MTVLTKAALNRIKALKNDRASIRKAIDSIHSSALEGSLFSVPPPQIPSVISDTSLFPVTQGTAIIEDEFQGNIALTITNGYCYSTVSVAPDARHYVQQALNENVSSPSPIPETTNFLQSWLNLFDAGQFGGPPVLSVFGRTGVITAQTGDYSAAQVVNAVDQTQSYSNPAWISSFPYSKITGAPAASSVTAAPPYINVAGTLYLATKMYAVSLPNISGWSILSSGSGTLSTTTNGVATFDVPGGVQSWAYSGAMTAFTKMDVICNHAQYLVNNGSNGDWLGVYAWDSANNNIWTIAQHTSYWDQFDVAQWSWSGSATPSGANYWWVMQGLIHQVANDCVFRVQINAAAKTIQFYVSLDGGVNFKLTYTTGAQTNTPTFTGILLTASAGTLSVLSLKTS